MSRFMEVVEGKNSGSVENLRVSRSGKMTYLLDGKMVREEFWCRCDPRPLGRESR